MPEHVHLLISEPEEGTPSTVMQVVKQRGLAQPSILISSRTTTKAAPSFAIFEGWARCCLQRLCSASMASGVKSPQILPSPDGTAKAMPFHKPALAAARTSIFQAKTLKKYGSVVPTLAKNARVGRPQSWCVPTRRRSGPSAPGNSVIPSSIDSHLSKITKRGPRPTSNRIEEFFRTAPLKPTLGLNGPPAKGCDSVRHNDGSTEAE